MTRDHKPGLPSEEARINAAGGQVRSLARSFARFVSFRGPNNNEAGTTPSALPVRGWLAKQVIDGRVDGVLGVSRALGDFDLKAKDARPSTACGAGPKPWGRVSALPEVTTIRRCGWGVPITTEDALPLSPREEDAAGGNGSTDVDRRPRPELLLVACDGIWDHVSSEQAVRLVWDQLARAVEQENAPTLLCRALCNEALARGSDDNVTVLLALFDEPAAALSPFPPTAGPSAASPGLTMNMGLREDHPEHAQRNGVRPLPTAEAGVCGPETCCLPAEAWPPGGCWIS